MTKTYVTAKRFLRTLGGVASAATVAGLLWGCAGDTNYVPEDVARGTVTTDTTNDTATQAANEARLCRQEVDRLAAEVADLSLAYPQPSVGVTIKPEVIETYCASPASGFRPLSCTFRSSGFNAFKLYGPSRWVDFYAALDFGCPGQAVTIPHELAVIRGCAGNHTATLTVTTADEVCKLTYKGQGQTSHCTGPDDTGVRNFYAYESDTCSFGPGDVVKAEILSGRVDNSANKPADQFRDVQVFFDFSPSDEL